MTVVLVEVGAFIPVDLIGVGFGVSLVWSWVLVPIAVEGLFKPNVAVGLDYGVDKLEPLFWLDLLLLLLLGVLDLLATAVDVVPILLLFDLICSHPLLF